MQASIETTTYPIRAAGAILRPPEPNAARHARKRPWRTQRWLVLPILLAAALKPAAAADWYASPDGKDAAKGTKDSPWDITSALAGKQTIHPGDTLWLMGGTYKAPAGLNTYGFEVHLAGTTGKPIQIRVVPAERVTIDGGLNVLAPSTYLRISDLEIMVSEPRPAGPIPPDPSYAGTKRPWGGLNIYSGEECKYVNLVIHDNNQGVSWWIGSRDSELYGCIIYNNGWAGTDRGHGHAIYTQNQDGVKTVEDCIMTGGYGYTLHAYGSARAYVDNYVARGNIVYNSNTFLIGGGRPSHNIRALENFLYNAPMQIGYSAPYNEDCEVRDNLIVNGALSVLKYHKAVDTGNTVIAPNAPRPPGARIVLRPNRYDPNRANLAIFNWEEKPQVSVEVAPFLKPGDHYRLLNPTGFYGKPVQEGVYNGHSIPVDMKGEFAAFVMLKAIEPKRVE